MNLAWADGLEALQGVHPDASRFKHPYSACCMHLAQETEFGCLVLPILIDTFSFALASRHALTP